MGWVARGACGLLLSGLVFAAAAAPAGAVLTGGCTASGTIVSTGRSYDAVKTNFAKIPRAGDVKWKARVPVPATKRAAVGEVQVEGTSPSRGCHSRSRS